MPRQSCLCLTCGRHFELVLPEGEELSRQKCPVCGAANLVSYNPASFFSSLFGGRGGG